MFCIYFRVFCRRVCRIVGVKNRRECLRDNLVCERLLAICWLCWLLFLLKLEFVFFVIIMAIVFRIGLRLKSPLRFKTHDNIAHIAYIAE